MSAQELAAKIKAFLEKYGKRDVNDPSEWSSPDACLLEMTAKKLEAGMPVERPFSMWGSGGYGPYASKEGRKLHDEILDEIEVFSKKK